MPQARRKTRARPCAVRSPDAPVSGKNDRRPLVQKRGLLLPGREHVHGRRRRRRGRLRRPAAPAGLPVRSGGHRPVVAAVPAFAQPRRRLRHQGLLRRRSAPRQPGRLRRIHPAGPAAGHPRDHRSGDQPHLGPAPVVQSRRARIPTRAFATTTTGRRRSRSAPTRAWCFPACRRPPGPTIPRRAPTITTASTPSSPTSTSRTRRSRKRFARSWASGCSSGSRASGSTPCRSSSRPCPRPTGPRRHRQGEAASGRAARKNGKGRAKPEMHFDYLRDLHDFLQWRTRRWHLAGRGQRACRPRA